MKTTHRALIKLDSKGKTPPSEFQLFAPGPHQSTKGEFTFDERSAQLVMEEHRAYGNDRSSDYEHQSLHVPPIESPASSWFDLEVREGALWAVNVRWTDNALKRLAAGEYRYFSPAFYTDEEGCITGFINFALTNLPATHDMEPLVAASRRALDQRTVSLSTSFSVIAAELDRAVQEAFRDQSYTWVVEIFDDKVVVFQGERLYELPYTFDGVRAVVDPAQAVEVQRNYTPVAPGGDEGEQPMKTLLAALSLAAVATEAEGVAAVTALKSSEESAKRRAGDLEREVIALTGATSIDDARGRLVGLKAAADQVTALNTKIAMLEGEKVTSQVDALIAQGEAEGKITPATKPMLLSMGKANPESLKGFLAVAPKVVALGALKEPTEGTKVSDVKASDTVVALTAEDKQVAKRLNISEKDFAASKNATLQSRSAS